MVVSRGAAEKRGLITSRTTMREVQVEALLLVSRTVNTTVFKPRLAQLKEDLLRANFTTPQRFKSTLPLSIWAAVMLPLPVASKSIVMPRLQTALGGKISCNTRMFCGCVLMLPFPSL